ncbi:EthD domain-containing protein [[Mycobacterium] wendilense]|uniref:EthD domain-containing protein n=1 Tax=[Mycobacterium] wendilense TaxID=3064284 RepID=A0ABM9MDQ9_9MYCO|nr:EthD domain-containing protein [Mycolicibacterium sp. MU0050]CAJ1582691.1 EthD domain-containing protein [Mycolicibacterium sp. MU0050]
MEKVILVSQCAAADDAWCARLRGPVAAELLDLGLPGLTINVKDAAVRDSLMTLTTLNPPVAAVLSLWTDQHYGAQVAAAVELLAGESDAVAGYLVTESVPLRAPEVELGSRTPGLANVALLRRPPELDEPTWRTRWHRDHTPVAIETQATFGYTQNAVVRALTPDAPAVAAIVEELFPADAVTDLKAFFGAADDADLAARIDRMVASTARFGANRNVDTVPTSRYVLRSAVRATG